MSDNIYGGRVADLLSLQQPAQDEAIKKVAGTKLYPVFNPGKPFKVKFKGEVSDFDSGETLVPVVFAIWLLGKFAPNEYDRPENNPRVLRDGKAVADGEFDDEEKAPTMTAEEVEMETKKLEEMTAIKYLLDDNNVPYPEDASISKLRKMRTALNKKLKAKNPDQKK